MPILRPTIFLLGFAQVMNVIDSLAFLWSKEYRKFTLQLCHP